MEEEIIRHWLCFRSVMRAMGYSFYNSVFRNSVALLCRTTQLKLEQLYSKKKKPTSFITKVEEMCINYSYGQPMCGCKALDYVGKEIQQTPGTCRLNILINSFNDI